jgi:hypothetical protein
LHTIDQSFAFQTDRLLIVGNAHACHSVVIPTFVHQSVCDNLSVFAVHHSVHSQIALHVFDGTQRGRERERERAMARLSGRRDKGGACVCVLTCSSWPEPSVEELVNCFRSSFNHRKHIETTRNHAKRTFFVPCSSRQMFVYRSSVTTQIDAVKVAGNEKDPQMPFTFLSEPRLFVCFFPTMIDLYSTSIDFVLFPRSSTINRPFIDR